MSRLISTISLILIFPFYAASGQPGSGSTEPAANDPIISFEAASIKPVDASGPPRQDLKVYPGGRVVIRGYSLKALILTAYNVGYWQLSGGEPWEDKDLYDIDAVAPASSPTSPYDSRHTWWRIEDPRLRQMLQSLLLERFQLTLRQETKPGTIYLLEATHKTPLIVDTKVRPSNHQPGDDGFSGDIGHAGDRWVIYNTSMAQFAKFASDIILHAPVLDRTGLDGYFDARWTETLTDPGDFDGINSFDLFVRALGLRLTKSKGTVETNVIVSAARPSPN